MTGRRELILYATPTGALADQIRSYFECVHHTLGPSTAQTYPPHCTLTGFFRRQRDHGDHIVDTFNTSADAGLFAEPVEVGEIMVTDDWVGLPLTSTPLLHVAQRFADAQRLDDGDDAIRLKSWLHVSLAYGTINSAAELNAYAETAHDMIDVSADVGWHVGVWERLTNGSWTQHTAVAA